MPRMTRIAHPTHARRRAHHAHRTRRPLPVVPLTTALALPALALFLQPTATGDASAGLRPSQAMQGTHAAAAPDSSFIASVDTMKESRDTETRPLSDAQIADDIAVAASLNTTYITVDTHWDYPAYMLRWADAVRAAGRHVWFRIHPNQWGNNNGTTGIMTPAQYEDSERAFILANPAIFRPGDILDPCPEPENGRYWVATYDDGWTAGAPNAATEEYNRFIRDTTDVADAALRQDGIDGVITTVRSTNSFFASHPGALEAATVARMGRVTVDSYPEGTATDPQTATRARIDELNTIRQAWGVPVVIGEMGYSNKVAVDDATQEVVLKAEFNALSSLPYLAGANYWVGAGTDNSGGYTHIFAGSTGNWTPRPAALYALRTSTDPQATASATLSATSVAFGTPGPTSPTADATASATSTPMATATSRATPTNTAVSVPTATNTPMVAPTATSTSTGTATATRARTSTATATATNTSTPTATATNTSTPTVTPPVIATVTPSASATSSVSTPLSTMSPTTVAQPANPTAGPTATATEVSAPAATATLVTPTSTPPPHGRPPAHCRPGHGKRRCVPDQPHRRSGSGYAKTPGSRRLAAERGATAMGAGEVRARRGRQVAARVPSFTGRTGIGAALSAEAGRFYSLLTSP